MLERFYNTAGRQGFHWPGRIVAGAGVLKSWLSDESKPPCIIADAGLRDHRLIAGDIVGEVGREPCEDDALRIARRLALKRPDAIVAIGGGATIDTAKAVCAHLRYGSFDVRDRPRTSQTPRLIAVPTTAGSGSETSRFFILANAATGVKMSMRSWSVVPDITLLEPAFLETLGPQRLLLGAFDAAIHLLETHIARGESSAFTDGLAQAHLPRILANLPAIVSGVGPSSAARLDLMTASAMAGICISNVRTGLLHTLGEALSAQMALPHPLTLRVFLRPVVESYAAAIAEETAPLWRMADACAPWNAPWGPGAFIAAWERAFAAVSLDETLHAAFAAKPPSLDRLCETASRDTTIHKENPLPLGPDMLRLIAAAGLSAFKHGSGESPVRVNAR